MGFWKECAVITSGAVAAVGATWFFRPGGISGTEPIPHHALAAASLKLAPVATAILKVAETPIPKATQVAVTTIQSTPNYESLLWGVGITIVGVLGAIGLFKLAEGLTWIKENFLEHDIQINAKRKIKGVIQDVTILTKDPKLAKALILETGEEPDITVDGLPLPVTATFKAIERVFEYDPKKREELLEEIKAQEADLKRRAGIRF